MRTTSAMRSCVRCSNGKVDLRPRVFVDPIVADVADDADDGHPAIEPGDGDPDAAPDRIGAAEQPREMLVDDRDRRRGPAIAAVNARPASSGISSARK